MAIDWEGNTLLVPSLDGIDRRVIAERPSK